MGCGSPMLWCFACSVASKIRKLRSIGKCNSHWIGNLVHRLSEFVPGFENSCLPDVWNPSPGMLSFWVFYRLWKDVWFSPNFTFCLCVCVFVPLKEGWRHAFALACVGVGFCFRACVQDTGIEKSKIGNQEKGVCRRGFLQNVRLSLLWRSECQMYCRGQYPWLFLFPSPWHWTLQKPPLLKPPFLAPEKKSSLLIFWPFEFLIFEPGAMKPHFHVRSRFGRLPPCQCSLVPRSVSSLLFILGMIALCSLLPSLPVLSLSLKPERRLFFLSAKAWQSDSRACGHCTACRRWNETPSLGDKVGEKHWGPSPHGRHAQVDSICTLSGLPGMTRAPDPVLL